METRCVYPVFSIFIDETRSELVAGKVLFRELPALNRVQCNEGDDQTDRCFTSWILHEILPEGVSVVVMYLRFAARYFLWWAFPSRVRVRTSGKLKSGDFEAVRAL